MAEGANNQRRLQEPSAMDDICALMKPSTMGKSPK
jgi:hypothetical protein